VIHWFEALAPFLGSKTMEYNMTSGQVNGIDPGGAHLGAAEDLRRRHLPPGGIVISSV